MEERVKRNGIYSFSCGVGRNNVEMGKMSSDIKDQYETYSSRRKKKLVMFERVIIIGWSHLKNSYLILYYSFFLKLQFYPFRLYRCIYNNLRLVCDSSYEKLCSEI